MESRFFGDMPLQIQFFLVFLVVLCLIGVIFWAVRRFGTGRFGGASTRGRQPRLAVIDYASVDGRRRLILVRRDNVEHLLMIGGPTDVVVEANIVRAVAAPRDVAAGRPTAGIEALPRAIPLPENGNGWPLQPEPAGAPRAASRSESSPEEPATWPLPPHGETTPRPQRDTLAALADELSTRPAAPRKSPVNVVRPHPAEQRPEPRPEPRVEPRPEPRIPMAQPAAVAPPAAAEDAAAADESLADMAHRLEAALRKPNAAADTRHSVTPARTAPAPEQAQPAEAAAPVPTARAPRPPEPKQPARVDVKPNQGKTPLYDSLEQEMASLLGRPTKN
jgi:hypothetical protein